MPISVCHSIYWCAKSHQMHAPLCMLMHLVINDSEKQIKSYFLHFSIWSKHVEVYVVRVCSDHFWKKSVHLKIALDMVQMIWTFDIFMTKLQNCKNNLVQNSDTRRTMIYNCLKMVILRPLEIIVPLVSEFWTKLFLQFWSFVMKISKVQIIWTMSSAIFKWTDFFQKRSLHTGTT